MFVFGTQYLRGMTPKRCDWARDMASMKSLRMNTIRAWLVWGILEPAPGQIDTDYLDAFLDCAGEHGLQVVLLFHLHGCPEWMISRYPQYWYVGEDGLPFEPSARSNTPSGGWPGLCPDHTEVQAMEAQFMAGVMTHVRQRSEVAFWEPINEPHMWVDMAKDPPGTFCYCPETRCAFRHWLQAKYGELSALGMAWGRRFSDWDDVRPPTWRFNFTDWVDWRTFTSENITALVKRRVEVMRGYTERPIIGHAWGGGCVSHPQLGAMAFDDWKNADVLDKWGYSAFPGNISSTMMVGLGTDATRNAAAGKEFWQSELGSGDNGCGVDRYGRVRPELLAMWSWESIRHGAQGLLYWQFRKEAHGSEFGAYGMTTYAGGLTENAAMAASIGRVLNEHAPLFHAACYPKPSIGILFSFQSYMTEWAQHRHNKVSMDALSGYYRMCWEGNFPVDILHEEIVTEEMLLAYKVIFLPMPVALAPAIRALLPHYVSTGGTIISDPYLCAFDADKALAEEVPGGGFAQVFGCHEDDVTMMGERTVELEFGGQVYHISGGHFLERLIPHDGAEVLARCADGSPAIIANNLGLGRAVLLNMNLGVAYSKKEGVGDDFTRQGREPVGDDGKQILLSLLQTAGVRPQILTPDGIYGTVLESADGQAVLIVIHQHDVSINAKIELPREYRSCRDLLQDAGKLELNGNILQLEFAHLATRVIALG